METFKRHHVLSIVTSKVTGCIFLTSFRYGRLNVGDQILVCDGVNLIDVTHDEAAQALKKAMDMESVSHRISGKGLVRQYMYVRKLYTYVYNVNDHYQTIWYIIFEYRGPLIWW